MKKIISIFLITTIFILTLSGCQKKSKEENTLKKVTLNEVAHSIFYAPQYVAIEKGYFEEEGLEINLVNGKGADNVMTSLISGDADIGFMGSEASIYVYAGGAKNYAVNFAGLTQRAGNFLVSRNKEPDFKWSDLKGKTVIGGRMGGMPEMVFEYILKKNKINLKDVNIIQNIDFGSTAAAFAGGTGDYTIEFEPFAASLEKEGKGVVAASLGTDSGYIPYTAYCALQSYMDKNDDTIQKFTNAIQRGLDYVNYHSAKEIARVIQPQFPETEEDTLVKIVDRYLKQDTWKETTRFDKDSYQLLIDILKDAGQLEADVPYDKIVTTKYSR